MAVISLKIHARQPYAEGQHFGDAGAYERLDGIIIAFPAILPDHDQALVLVFAGNLIQVRNGRLARPAPSGPELDDVSLVLVETLHRLTLDPFAGLEFGGGVAHFERRSFRGGLKRHAGCERQQGARESKFMQFHVVLSGLFPAYAAAGPRATANRAQPACPR